MSYLYTTKVLREQLQKEEKDLSMWENIIILNKDINSVKQAKGNISSTQHRIEELKKVLEIIS